MTGLDDTKDHILEAACLITDADLNIIADGPNLIINQPDNILNSMNEWCMKTHTEVLNYFLIRLSAPANYNIFFFSHVWVLIKSGLVKESRESNINVQAAEEEILNFVKMHTNPGECCLAGNSIGEDKRFLIRFMPHLVNHLHYRIVDVSSIKELCRFDYYLL